MSSCANGHLDIVKYLLEETDADVHARNNVSAIDCFVDFLCKSLLVLLN